MDYEQAKLIAGGLESIARSITGLTVSMMALATSVESAPLRQRVASAQPPDEAEKMLRAQINAAGEALKTVVRAL